MKRVQDWLLRFRWQKLLLVWGVFLLIAAVLFAERSGVQYTHTRFRVSYLPQEQAISKAQALQEQPATCLLLCDTRQSGVDDARELFTQLLQDMKVAADVVDLAEVSVNDLPAPENYRTAVVLMPNVEPLGEELLRLMNWVEDGGGLLFGMSPSNDRYFNVVSAKLGVMSTSGEYKQAESIVPAEGFMLGGGQRYELSDPFDSSLAVALREDTEVYATTGDEKVPLIWGRRQGRGRIVVDNIGIYDKVMRGFYAASYSLLQDAVAYPVINSAVFYLDDFPSPVPGGDGTYIRRDYGLSISDFYSQVWWPDLTQLAERYGIHYTGVMIENYEDDTLSAPQRQADTEQFRYFGGLLLRQGGEIGYHGYNHQPLCLPDTDYGDAYAYNQWPNADAITAAMDELTAVPEQTTLVPPPQSEPLRLVGEVFKTYIITERGGELCLIDKHAAHERILFEQLARDYGNVPSQMLLVPVQVNLTAAEKQAVLQNLDLLTDAGIEAEDFGGSTVVVRAVPADVAVDDVEDMLVELAAKLADGGRDALREKTEWVLHSIACRAAIKAGDHTNAAEMLALAQHIMDGTVPPFCPHGRPCVLKITRKELEKQFGRLV